ncbi:MAG: hypothetical protein MJ252_17755, partial [archaeon]|nr:hypothetical protein [archaeon]
IKNIHNKPVDTIKNDSIQGNYEPIGSINNENNQQKEITQSYLPSIKSENNKDIENQKNKNEIENYDDGSFLYKLNKTIGDSTILSFILFSLALFAINIIIWDSNKSNIKELSLFESAMYNTFAKVIFISAFGIIIHLCFLGRYRFIFKFLTMKIQTSTSRSTYGIYMIHVFYVIAYGTAYQNFYYLSFYDAIFLAIGIYFVSWITSLSIGLLIESPMISILKLILLPKKK